MPKPILFFAIATSFAFFSYAQPNIHVNYNRDSLGVPTGIYWINNSEYWLATTSGIGHYWNDGKNEKLHLKDTLNWSVNARVIKVHNNTVWVGSTNHGLYKYAGGSWSNFNQSDNIPNSPITDISFAANGAIYVLTESSVLTFDSISQKFQSFGTGGSSLVRYNQTLYKADFQSIQNPGAYYDGQNWISLPANSHVGRNKSTRMEITSDSTLFSSSLLGVSKLVNGVWQDITNNSIGNKMIVANGQYVYSIDENSELIKYTGNQIDTGSKVSYNRLWSPPIPLDVDNNQTITILEDNGVLIRYNLRWTNAEAIYEEVHVGRIKAGFSPTGDLFNDFSPQTADNDGFVGLIVDSKTAVFTANPWFTGIDANNDTLACAQQYRQNGADQFSGPISDVYDSTYLNKYNHVWKVTSSEIKTHIQNFGNTSYVMPYGIANWPGNGNTNNGEAHFLAPFVDDNFNGKYEPLLGDYPDIRGDEAVYFIYNDARGLKMESGSKPMFIEVHGMAYVYDTAFTPLRNTIFLNYKVMNRSPNDYTNFTFGLWTDFDLGNSIDDAIGSDSVNKIVYVFNGDIDDEGPLGHGLYPPALGISFLNTPMDGFMYYQNTPNNLLGNPTEISHYFNYLNSTWKDGTPLTLENPSGFGSGNGDGYDPTGMSPPTKWAFNDAANWFQPIASQLDNRSISYRTVGDFIAGSEVCLNMAFIYARDSSSSNILASMSKMKSYLPDVLQFNTNKGYGCLGEYMDLIEDRSVKSDLIHYPNPLKPGQSLYLESKKGIQRLALYNVTGQCIQESNPQKNHPHSYNFPIHSDVVSGMYLLTVQFEDNTHESLKVLIGE